MVGLHLYNNNDPIILPPLITISGGRYSKQLNGTTIFLKKSPLFLMGLIYHGAVIE